MIKDFVIIAKTFACFVLMVAAIRIWVLPHIVKIPEHKVGEPSQRVLDVVEEHFDGNVVANAKERTKGDRPQPHELKDVDRSVNDGVETSDQKLAEGIERIREKAERGDAEEQYTLSLSFLHGYGNEKSWERALEWLQKSAQGGYARAQCDLGLRYLWGGELQGNRLPKNLKVARFWLENAAKAKDPKVKEAAENGIGRINLIEIMGGEESMEQTRSAIEADEEREKFRRSLQYRRNFLEAVGGEEKLKVLEDSL